MYKQALASAEQIWHDMKPALGPEVLSELAQHPQPSPTHLLDHAQIGPEASSSCHPKYEDVA